MVDLFQFTIHFENPTVNFSALCNSCAKIVLCLSELIAKFFDEESSIQNANEHFFSRINISFVYFALHPTPTKNNLQELGLEIQTDSHNSNSVTTGI